jgi:hypothetical protein
MGAHRVSALLACGSVALAIAMTFFVKTLYNNKYYFLPDSSRTSEYKKLLEQTYRISGLRATGI